MEPPRSQIERSWRTLFLFMAMGLAAFPAGYALIHFVGGKRGYGLGLGFMGGGLVLLVLGVVLSRKATCPACGETLHGIVAGATEKCMSCGVWVDVKDVEIHQLPDDHVAARPVFRTTLPARPVWPPRCAACDGPSTRTRSLTSVAGKDAAGNELPPRTIEVPHCEQHDDGASLNNGLVSFRSYAYLREFLVANGMSTVPRRPAA